MSVMNLTGIHHLTAVSAEIRKNHRFYTQTMGMRLVKRSVNQDDTSAYHLFYSDAVGSPGNDLTFFDFPVPRERRGTRSITRTHLRVNGQASLEWWANRLPKEGASGVGPLTHRDGRLTLDFEDFEGSAWRSSTMAVRRRAGAVGAQPVPAEHQIRGLGRF